MINGLLHDYLKRRGNRIINKDDVSCQERWFYRLMQWGARTQFGRDYDFASIRHWEDYQQRVPLQNYDALAGKYYKKDGTPPGRGVLCPESYPYVALSSGSTQTASKRLPLSARMLGYHQRAAWDVLALHALHGDPLDATKGIFFMLGGSTALTRHGAVAEGDLSAIAMTTIPALLRSRVFPPLDIALVDNWEQKLDKLVNASLIVRERVTVLSGATSWLLLLLHRIRDACGDIPFPNLRLLIHGGMAWWPYHERFMPLVHDLNKVRCEVYAASEAFIAVGDGEAGEELSPPMRLLCDHGVFYEFVPQSEMDKDHPAAVSLRDVQCGVDYAIVVSTISGLWRYVMGDCVRFCDVAPPRLVVTGRLAWHLSIVGEHVSGAEIERALQDGLSQMLCLGKLREYSVGAILESDGRARHHYVIETDKKGEPENWRQLSRLIDRALQKSNDDYRMHRAKDVSLLSPLIHYAPAGVFLSWMKARGKLGGQNKVPRVIREEALLQNLIEKVKDNIS